MLPPTVFDNTNLIELGLFPFALLLSDHTLFATILIFSSGTLNVFVNVAIYPGSPFTVPVVVVPPVC